MTDLNTEPVRRRLEQARDQLTAAERLLSARVPDLGELYTAVDGAIQVTTAVANLVDTVMRQAPATLDHRSGPTLSELLADLRAMHGCLTTGPLLLAPAREDLHHILTSQHGEPAMLDDLNDAVPAHDVADHRRSAPVLDETGPWP